MDSATVSTSKSTDMGPSEQDAYLYEWPDSERLKKVLQVDAPRFDHCYTMPAIKSISPLPDPIVCNAKELLNRSIERISVETNESGLRQLIRDGHLRSAVNVTSTLLSAMNHGVGMAGQPSKITLENLRIWSYRFQLLMALKMYTLLNDELLPFEELDAPDLYFQYYPTIYTDSRKGSLVPFSLRLVHAESLRFTPYPWAATKRIDALEMNVQKVIRNLKEKQTTNAQHLDLWKQRLLSVQKIRARTLFFLKEYGTSMSLYGRIASQEENESHRLAIRLMLARMALSIGSEKEAERYFKEVTQLDEDEILVYKSLKCIFNGNYSQAYEHLQRISKTVQSNAKIRNNTAVCLLYIGKPLDALKILNDQHSTNGNGSDVVPNEPICINSVNIAELATCAIKQYKEELFSRNVDKFPDMFDPAILKL